MHLKTIPGDFGLLLDPEWYVCECAFVHRARDLYSCNFCLVACWQVWAAWEMHEASAMASNVSSVCYRRDPAIRFGRRCLCADAGGTRPSRRNRGRSTRFSRVSRSTGKCGLPLCPIVGFMLRRSQGMAPILVHRPAGAAEQFCSAFIASACASSAGELQAHAKHCRADKKMSKHALIWAHLGGTSGGVIDLSW